LRPHAVRTGINQQREARCHAFGGVADQVHVLHQSPTEVDAGDLAKFRMACERDGCRGVLLARPEKFIEPKGSGIVVGPAEES
jgi:hypothetical protein